MESMDFNEEFRLAADFVLHTNKNIFLTGKAGTGKTTFLKYIREHCSKNAVVLAPTGVAAINAGGATLHSFFQLPFSAFIPETGGRGFRDENVTLDANSFFQRTHFHQTKIDLYRELELLIIDEVSMLRCDYLDCIDFILRRFRRQYDKPFGGVQVLFIGDLFQLPPVIKENEWNELRQHYETGFFFSAKVLQENLPLIIELKKIYRQNEEKFIRLLNKIRNNEMDEENFELLNSRFQGYIDDLDGYITLCTHNWKADKINQVELQKLEGELFKYNAKISGDFDEKEFPMEHELNLKIGAQIMFNKNDSSEEKKYFNGKLATIKRLEQDKIVVSFKDDRTEFELRTETWKKVKFKLNGESNKIEEDVIGTFTHFPIKLAWAITIHKSQGLTFEKAVIDAGQSFAAGQVYVALSRCTNLEGMILQSEIPPKAIQTDARIIDFEQKQFSTDSLQTTLEAEKRVYQKTLLVKAFNWNGINKSLEELKESIFSKQIPDKEKAETMLNLMLDANKNLNDTNDKFIPKVQEALAADDFNRLKNLLERAIPYYCDELHNKFMKPLSAHIQDLADKQRVKKYLQDVVKIESLWWNKLEQLQKLQYNETIFFKGEILKKSFDQKILKEKIDKKKQKGDSHRETFEMYKSGKKIAEIAEQRGLARITVEGHLAVFIEEGKLDVHEFLNNEKLQKMIAVIESSDEKTLTPLKEKLGDDFSYGEIRMALAHLKRN